jgi:hypothetical protein
MRKLGCIATKNPGSQGTSVTSSKELEDFSVQPKPNMNALHLKNQLRTEQSGLSPFGIDIYLLSPKN